MNFPDISEIWLVIFALFPGFVFAHFYLKAIDEYARSENLKLISLHSFFAVIFVTFYVVFSLLLFKLVNYFIPFKEWLITLHYSSKIIIFLIYYFFTFIIAAMSGNLSMKKEFLYEKVKPLTYWNKMLKQRPGIAFFVTCLINIGEKSFIYIGFLDDYKTYNNSLDYLVLNSAHRRALEDDSSESDQDIEERLQTERFYFIDVDKLIINYSDIKTLGIKTFRIERKL